MNWHKEKRDHYKKQQDIAHEQSKPIAAEHNKKMYLSYKETCDEMSSQSTVTNEDNKRD